MKYLALIYQQQGSIEKLSDDQMAVLYAGHAELQKISREEKVFVLADKLASSDTATSIIKDKDKLTLRDGPFAETREILGGYYVFECNDLDQALHYAKMIPMVEGTTIEVRPITAHFD